MWNIEKIIKKGNYDYALVKGHPNATKNGYVLLHRIIMENFIDRILNDQEIVHHKDGNMHNNDISNLEIMDRIEHLKFHGGQKKKTICILICPNCGISFERERRQLSSLKGGKLDFCSRSCNGKYYMNKTNNLCRIEK
jgi:hypothetical protein